MWSNLDDLHFKYRAVYEQTDRYTHTHTHRMKISSLESDKFNIRVHHTTVVAAAAAAADGGDDDED